MLIYFSINFKVSFYKSRQSFYKSMHMNHFMKASYHYHYQDQGYECLVHTMVKYPLFFSGYQFYFICPSDRNGVLKP